MTPSRARIVPPLAACMFICGGPSAAPADQVQARIARSLNVRDTAHLHNIPAFSEGSTVTEEGTAVGGLPGKLHAHLKVESTISGTFVFYTRGGTLKGRAVATPSGAGRYQSFRGTMVVSGGTGQFSHAQGKAALYGLFDRQTYALTVQTVGHLSY